MTSFAVRFCTEPGLNRSEMRAKRAVYPRAQHGQVHVGLEGMTTFQLIIETAKPLHQWQPKSFHPKPLRDLQLDYFLSHRQLNN